MGEKKEMAASLACLDDTFAFGIFDKAKFCMGENRCEFIDLILAEAILQARENEA